MARPKKTADQSSTVSVSLRIDPRIKYGIDLAARIQKRTVTGVVEWAVEQALGEVTMPPSVFIEDEDPDAPHDLASHLDDLLWSSSEGVRLMLLASRYPSLLSFDETKIWETIKLSPPFWNRLPKSAKDCDPWENAKLEAVASSWQLIVKLTSKRKEIAPITYADLGMSGEIDELESSIRDVDKKLSVLFESNPSFFMQVRELQQARDALTSELVTALNDDFRSLNAAGELIPED